MEDLGLDGRIILKLIFETWDGSKNWIDLSQDKERWGVVVNGGMNLLVPYNEGNFLTS